MKKIIVMIMMIEWDSSICMTMVKWEIKENNKKKKLFILATPGAILLEFK